MDRYLCEERSLVSQDIPVLKQRSITPQSGAERQICTVVKAAFLYLINMATCPSFSRRLQSRPG